MNIKKCNKCGGRLQQRVTRLITKNIYEEKIFYLETIVYLKCEKCNCFLYLYGNDFLYQLIKKEIITVSQDFIDIVINELCYKN